MNDPGPPPSIYSISNKGGSTSRSVALMQRQGVKATAAPRADSAADGRSVQLEKASSGKSSFNLLSSTSFEDNRFKKSAPTGRQTAANQRPRAQHTAKMQAIADAGTIQRFKVGKTPETNQIFSVSDDKGILAGMGTPNHDLYVDDPNKIPCKKMP